jgi:adenylate kinase
VVLIDLNIEDLIERRRKDSRERIKDLGHMEKELEMNRTYFRQYCEDLLTQGYVIFNRDLETCVSELLEIVK